MPVINENDTVATAEIRFGDNDRLAARVAEMTGADQLILLSDIDGLYTADPKRDPRRSPPSAGGRGHAGDRGRWVAHRPPGYSSGGMRTKLAAARIATGAGCAMAIALGGIRNPLAALEAGARCTWFPAAADGRTSRKRWIAGSMLPAGAFTVDAGAAHGVARGGSSLLPAGLTGVEGALRPGRPGAGARCRGAFRWRRGLSAYGSEDAPAHCGAAVRRDRGRCWAGAGATS